LPAATGSASSTSTPCQGPLQITDVLSQLLLQLISAVLFEQLYNRTADDDPVSESSNFGGRFRCRYSEPGHDRKRNGLLHPGQFLCQCSGNGTPGSCHPGYRDIIDKTAAKPIYGSYSCGIRSRRQQED